MNPVTHFFISSVAASHWDDVKSQRAVVCAGVIPDIDGIGMLTDRIGEYLGYELNWWADYHRIAAHNLFFALIFAVICVIYAKRVSVFLGALITFHLHLFCDLLGGRGPDGFQWPINYLYPMYSGLLLRWKGQWELNAWPNFVITALVLLFLFYQASYRRSFLILFSERADCEFSLVMKKWFRKKEVV